MLLLELIQGQADEFTAVMGQVYEEWEFLAGAPPVLPEDSADGSQLLSRIEVDQSDGCYIRIGQFSCIEVIPAEWRRAAYRSFLPDEVPVLLDRWTRHIEEVRRGGHRPYLAAWHAYLMSRALNSGWERIYGSALSVCEQTNAWMRKPGVGEASERVLALPVPEVSAPPRWDEELPLIPFVDWAAYADAARVWDAAVRNRARGLGVPILTLDEFVAAQLEPEQLDYCFGWLGKAARGGYGLWLDY
ncbi:hypothetical protein ACFQ07_01415 [Actinomadura adrarensis]|uniref:Uncharacterized protein n=1 Tax=Actinomadura adrarensis TaxID=1819600 RepID=A0ABW3CAV9_9ACTN